MRSKQSSRQSYKGKGTGPLVTRTITSEVVPCVCTTLPTRGKLSKNLCLNPLGVSVTQAAQALTSAGRPCLPFSTAAQGSVLRWRFACRSRSALRLRAGSISKPSMTCGMPSSAANSFAWSNLRCSERNNLAINLTVNGD